MEQLAADLAMIVDRNTTLPALRGRAGGGEASRAGADDEQVAACVELGIVGRRAVFGIDDSEAGHRARIVPSNVSHRGQMKVL